MCTNVSYLNNNILFCSETLCSYLFLSGDCPQKYRKRFFEMRHRKLLTLCENNLGLFGNEFSFVINKPGNDLFLFKNNQNKNNH